MNWNLKAMSSPMRSKKSSKISPSQYVCEIHPLLPLELLIWQALYSTDHQSDPSPGIHRAKEKSHGSKWKYRNVCALIQTSRLINRKVCSTVKCHRHNRRACDTERRESVKGGLGLGRALGQRLDAHWSQNTEVWLIMPVVSYYHLKAPHQ